MKRTLIRLYITITVSPLIVSEGKTYTYIGIRILQPEKVFSAYPAVFVLKSSFNCINECFSTIRYVINNKMFILTG